jgi:glycerol-3-phosphate dehydrogenase (NAD(P)+)
MCGLIEQSVPTAQTACLSGPSLALEVARGIPTAVVAASTDKALAARVQSLFRRPTFRVYASTDLVGVELGGALKNVVAIAAGVCDGLQFGDNAKAALLTRALAEMTRLGVACGARAETFAGLSGLGDLTVTCFSRLSRNRTFGEQLGRGGDVAALLAGRSSVVEGYPTARSAHALALRLKISAPVIQEVHAMLYEGKPPAQAVRDLLSREQRAE